MSMNKHIKLYENYNKEDIVKMVNVTTKKGNMNIDVSIEEFIENGKRPKIGSFESFISGHCFISEGIKQRIVEVIQQFKAMGLDTVEAEKYQDSYKNYRKVIDDIEYHQYISQDEDMMTGLFDKEEEALKGAEKLDELIRSLHKQAQSISNS